MDLNNLNGEQLFSNSNRLPTAGRVNFKTSVSYVDTASENFGDSLDVVGEILNSPSGLFT